MSKLRIVWASDSPMQLDALRDALGRCQIVAEVEGVAASSGSSKPPVDEAATMRAIDHRITQARRAKPDRDWYLATQYGVFHESNDFVDHAIVCAQGPEGQIKYSSTSEGVKISSRAIHIVNTVGADLISFEELMEFDNKNGGSEISKRISPSLQRKQLLTNALVDLFKKMKASKAIAMNCAYSL